MGTGRNLPFYSQEVDVHAVDLSQAMLARARRRGRDARCRISFERADALDLSHIPEGSFDWYVATFLYCVLPDELHPQAFQEMARVLRPGGGFRLVELRYSKDRSRRLAQRLLTPYANWVFGARFDRHTRRHLRSSPNLILTRERWLKGDTQLLLEGRRRAAPELDGGIPPTTTAPPPPADPVPP